MKTVKIIILTAIMVVSALNMAVAQTPAGNKEIIKAGFDRWAKGEGSFFDLLTDDMQWTITGTTPLSKTYTSKKQFLAEVIDPLNQRLSKRITPTVRALYAEGNMVIVLMDGQAVAKDNRSYDMSYAWFMEMKNGKIVKVTAFLDGLQFTDIMHRLKGAQ
jgi:ketosteroid isomerase-like protein